MEFLTRHYEKLILAFFLLCLLFGIATAYSSINTTKLKLKDLGAKLERDVRGGKELEKMTAGDYTASKYLDDERKEFNVLGLGSKSPKGSLVEPNKLIMCVNEECSYLISLSADVCPFCGKEQPELAKETGIGDDTDSDGIPDSVENKYSFLNFRNPNDARMDYDGDGFLNIEEAQANTKLDDPDDFPALGTLLRTGMVVQNNINFKLVDIDKNRSEDPKDWNVIVTHFDAKTRKMRRNRGKVGDAFNNFKITKASFNGEGNAATPYIDVVDAKDESIAYTLYAGKDTPSKSLTVAFVNLNLSRNRSDAAALISARYLLVKNVGDEFQLQKAKRTSRVVENYKVLEANLDTKFVKIGLLGADGKTIKEIEVPLFNFNLDFMNDAQRGMDGAMEGGNDMAPGMEGGNPGGRRNNLGRRMQP